MVHAECFLHACVDLVTKSLSDEWTYSAEPLPQV